MALQTIVLEADEAACVAPVHITACCPGDAIQQRDILRDFVKLVAAGNTDPEDLENLARVALNEAGA